MLSARGGEATNGGAEAEAEADMLTNGVPHALHVYAQPALVIYEALVQERAALLDLMQELREVAPHAEVADLGHELDLPRLHPHPSPTPTPTPNQPLPQPLNPSPNPNPVPSPGGRPRPAAAALGH